MSVRLLREEEALRKIELSLKLNGKSFTGKYLDCLNCKFCWGKTYQRPISTKESYLDPITGMCLTKDIFPPKWLWYCFKYKRYPYHACLRFKVVRLDAEGQPITVKCHWVEGNEQRAGHYSSDPINGERDTLVLIGPNHYATYRVCRRFESTPRD